MYLNTYPLHGQKPQASISHPFESSLRTSEALGQPLHVSIRPLERRLQLLAKDVYPLAVSMVPSDRTA